MINFDGFVNKNKRQKSKLTTNPYGILMIGGSEWGKTNSLLNLSNQILTKFVYMLMIHLKQNINFWLRKERVQA